MNIAILKKIKMNPPKERAPRMTGWFKSTVRPVRRGVYEKKNPYEFGQVSKPMFSLWDGHEWKTLAGDPEFAAGCKNRTFYHTYLWRGLAERPK
jgi:hypothetical protein